MKSISLQKANSKNGKYMCKLDTIINTSERVCHSTAVAERGKSMEQIVYMTNILFSLAKCLQRPLDKTIENIEEKHLFPILDKAYKYRNKKNSNMVLKELADSILPA